MSTQPGQLNGLAPHGAGFLTTRWTRVLRLGGTDENEARRALEGLCGDYWKPLYEFARRKGHGPEDAQDLTQGFIAHLLEKDSLRRADPERGRFRTFLLAGFCNYMMGLHRSRTAWKRGGNESLISWEEAEGERGQGAGPADMMTPEREFERN